MIFDDFLYTICNHFFNRFNFFRIVLEERTAPLGPFLRRMAKVLAPNPIVNSEPSTETNLTEAYLK